MKIARRISISICRIEEPRTKLDDNLPEVIWMPREIEESLITNGRFILYPASKKILLDVAHGLHNESNRKEDHARDVSASSEIRLGILRNVRRIQDRDWQRASPNPEHLKDPETKEWEKFIPLVIETVVLACLEDSEEEKGRESSSPEHHEDRNNDLTGMMSFTECKRDDCKDHKVGSSGEICDC